VDSVRREVDKERISRLLVDATKEAGTAVLEALGPETSEDSIRELACHLIEEMLEETDLEVYCEKSTPREQERVVLVDARLFEERTLTVEATLVEGDQPLAVAVHLPHEEKPATVYALEGNGVFTETPEGAIKKIHASPEARNPEDLAQSLTDVPETVNELLRSIKVQEKASRTVALASRLIVEEARSAKATPSSPYSARVGPRLPDFLIVGAAKSGTTSLYKYLRQHPRIFMPDIKEPHFFCFTEKQPPFKYPQELQVIWRFEEYKELFRSAGEGQLIGESSTHYLYFYNESIQSIKKYVPYWKDLKIIIILRNPVDRAFSHYSMLRRTEMEHLEFDDALVKIRERIANGWRPGFDYIGYGLYYDQVKAYLDTFSFVRIFLLEDLKASVQQLIGDIFDFLEVESFEPDIATVHNRNEINRLGFLNKLITKPGFVSTLLPLVKIIPLEKRIAFTATANRLNSRRPPWQMTERTRRRLQEIYREDILKLQALIGRDLSAWLT
jgi:hypothetical protein